MNRFTRTRLAATTAAVAGPAPRNLNLITGASGFLGRIKRSPLRRGRDSRFTGALERFIETIDREAA